MQYKTIVLEMIEEYPAYRQKLADSSSLLSTMDFLALELRQWHLAMINQLALQSSNLSDEALRAQAAELVIADLQALIQTNAEN